MNGTTPIYVGFTSNLKSRIAKHRCSDKCFDGYVVVKTYESREEALIAENAIIRYLSMFGNPENVNGKYMDMVDKPLVRRGCLNYIDID